MNIRMAGKAETPALVEFNQQMALETEGKRLDGAVLERGVAAVFDDPAKGFYVVAEDSSEIMGGLLVTREWSDWRDGWFWWIQSVYVRPAARGTGVYKRLYEFVKAKAEEAGNVCGFRLYVERENEKAQRVYEKLGMEKTYYLMYEQALKSRHSD